MSEPSLPQQKGDLQALAITGLALASIGLIAIVLPASVFEFEKIRATYPLQDLYPDRPARYFLAGSVAAMFVAFVAAVVIARRMQGREAVLVALAGTVLLGGVFTFAFPSGSLDIYHNIADARTLWLHGDNPLRVPPADHNDSDIVRAVQAWRNQPSSYGPLSYIAYGPPVLVAGGGVAANLIAFKAYQALLLVALAWLAGKAAADLDPGRRVQAMVIAGWNPYAIYEGVVNGHNDLLMGLVAVLGLWLTGRRLLAGPAVVALSGAVKFVCGLATPLAALWLWRNGTPEQRRWLAVAVGLVVLAGVAVVALLFDDVDRIRKFATPSLTSFHSPISLLSDLIKPLAGSDRVTVARGVAWALLAATGLVCLARTGTTRLSLWRASFWLVLAAVYLGPTMAWQWYLLWFVPIGAVLAGSREADLTIVASGAVLFTYAFVPWATHTNTLNGIYVALVYGLPLLYVLAAPLLRLPTTVEGKAAIAMAAEPGAG